MEIGQTCYYFFHGKGSGFIQQLGFRKHMSTEDLGQPRWVQGRCLEITFFFYSPLKLEILRNVPLTTVVRFHVSALGYCIHDYVFKLLPP
jgi:hypothetical protein